MTSPAAKNAKLAQKTANIERAEIHKASKHIKESAENIADSAVEIEDSADVSTILAADRTVYAAERTYAAWVRTGFAALASGVGAKALLAHILPGLLVQIVGTVLTLSSAFCFGAAVWRELVPRFKDPMPNAPRIPKWILYAVNGVLVLVALAAMVSIWLGPYSDRY
ncbi:MAG: YidH family protein [Rhizomicrobium sp.]